MRRHLRKILSALLALSLLTGSAVTTAFAAEEDSNALTIDDLKDMGFWIGACDMGGQDYHKTDLTGKLAIVIGSEGQGISKLVRENCDFVVSMPMKGRITSLNAANAAAVIMYEVRRQRDGKR